MITNRILLLKFFEQGYLYKDKVIKHAKVIVSAAPEGKTESPEEQQENPKNEEEK